MSQAPAVSGKQLVKILEGQDWYVKRIRGSHHVMRHPDIPDAIPVPVHGNQSIKRGTLANILRTAGTAGRRLLEAPDMPVPEPAELRAELDALRARTGLDPSMQSWRRAPLASEPARSSRPTLASPTHRTSRT